MDAKMEKVEVTRWRCSKCNQVYNQKKDAEDCCEDVIGVYYYINHETKVEFNYETKRAIARCKDPIMLTVGDDSTELTVDQARDLISSLHVLISDYEEFKCK